MSSLRAATLLAAALVARGAPQLSCSTSSVCFSGQFSHSAILQRAPQRAALYGSVPAGAPVSAAVMVSLSEAGGYVANFSGTVMADRTWRVLLDPREAGGNYSVTVSCPACASGKHAQQQIHDVVFGDVWYLSGEQ